MKLIDWKDAVRTYEEEMFVRVTDAAKSSVDAAATELWHIALQLNLEMHEAIRDFPRSAPVS
jgi:hypothetical protein